MKRVLLVVVVFPAIALLVSGAPKSLSVTVVGADTSDPRWTAVEEAVGFWNQQLTAAGVNVRLGPVARQVRPVPDDALRELSEAVLGGRWDREIPKELQDIPGDILVVLSNGDFISFGMRWSRDRKGLVGLRRADIPPLSLPNVARNVIAHELGHVLGLRHNSDPATLMCGRPAPCRPALFASETNRFFPLTESDITTLQRAHGSSTPATGHPRVSVYWSHGNNRHCEPERRGTPVPTGGALGQSLSDAGGSPVDELTA